MDDFISRMAASEARVGASEARVGAVEEYLHSLKSRVETNGELSGKRIPPWVSVNNLEAPCMITTSSSTLQRDLS